MKKRPHVICHVLTTLDGRIVPHHWPIKRASHYFEVPASKMKCDAWIVGRTTMQEFSSKKPRKPRKGRFTIPPGDYIADLVSKTFAVAIDPEGKCNWDSNKVDTEQVIAVLTQKVSAEYLDYLRSKKVSYIFAGKRDLNLRVALEKLYQYFPIRHAQIQGGGKNNGAFLAAGVVDEVSVILMPIADGTIGSPSAFDMDEDQIHHKSKLMKLISVKHYQKDVLWLRYRVKNSA